MKKKNRIIAFLLTGILLLTTGCGKSKDSPQDRPVPAETVTAEQSAAPVSPENSLNSLRQAMTDTPQLFAVAYFGFHETQDPEFPVDPFAVLQENAPQLCADLPFLLEIPEDRIIGESGDLFCIVPLDENATVAVSKGYWDSENQQHIYDDMLYSSAAGDPILLFCNYAGWEPDTQVCIFGESGEVFWYPQEDDNHCVMPLRNDDWENRLYDFSPYREMLAAEYRRMEEYGWVMPTKEFLTGTTWRWTGFLKDGRDVSYEVTFGADTLSVCWNDGIDEMDHEYPDAAWELTRDGDCAVLSIDFREFAGVLRYNLLYHEAYEELYVAMDVVQEDMMNIGWEPLYRTLMRSDAPEPTEMIGSWELAWTEVDGYQTDEEQGTRWIEIYSAAAGDLLMSYGSWEFPDNDFYNELLMLDMRELYDHCGNNEWVADVNYVGPWDTTYTVTLTAEDILIKQNYFLLDGAPSVSYEYFRRVTGNTESPYDYAQSEGWQAPELSQLTDTFWLSWNGYALELMDDGTPGDNGGWAKLYDVDEIGAYTESYSGYWQYEDGLLHLSLVPAKGNGVFVDDSFPVLMLDGELRIGRTENGTGLPHFSSDMLMDTLEQPKG